MEEIKMDRIEDAIADFKEVNLQLTVWQQTALC